MVHGDIQLPFRDRHEAGRALAARLGRYGSRDDVLVLALPRGGVPVAWEIAEALGVPLDLMLVRKLGVPGHEELAMGAIAGGGALVLNEPVVRQLGIGEEALRRVIDSERAELARRDAAYRDERPQPDLGGRTVLIVDDGLATGSTMLAGVEALRPQKPRSVVIAVPVAPADTCERLAARVDDVICLTTPAGFMGVGQWYDDFSQVSDDQVRELLRRAWRREADRQQPLGEKR